MNQQIYIEKVITKPGRRKLLGFLLLAILTGCDVEKHKRDNYRASVNPEHGKIVEVNGEQFRIVYIGGVRFRFPDTYQFGWTGPYATDPTTDGVSISFNWPDVPPGKVPGIKFISLDPPIGMSNQVDVIVMGRTEPIEIDKSKTVGLPSFLNPANYIVHDDLTLGLRILSPKEYPGLPSYAYSLTDDALTPLEHQPVTLSSAETIYFNYAPKIWVRINMTGWIGHINPNWKGIYLGVVETLNKYREDK
jgi:hypothetical protein